MISLVKRNPWIFEYLAIAFVAYFLAKMTTNLVAVKLTAPLPVAIKATSVQEGVSPKQELLPVDAYQIVVERNVFDSANTGASAAEAESAMEETLSDVLSTGEAALTSLDIELVSTFAVGEGKDKRSNATLQGKEIGPEGEAFRVGESFMNGTEITQVMHDRMIFANRGRLEYVLLNDFVSSKGSGKSGESKTSASADSKASEAQADAEGNKFTIQKSEIDNAMANLDQLFTQIRAVPYTKDGKTSGMKLLSVKPDSIFSKLGLKRGDVLQKINGKDLNIQEGLSLFNTLKSETHLSLEILRRGKAQTLEYDVK